LASGTTQRTCSVRRCGGLASRPEGFVIWLTTQSDEAPAGIFKQKLDYARGVRDGRIDDKSFLPILYEFPEAILKKKKHLDPKHWYITNPNLGASVDEDFILRESKRRKRLDMNQCRDSLPNT